MNRKRVWQKKTMNLEPCSGVELGFIPSKKIPKQDFLDRALMGVGPLKPTPGSN